MSLKSQFEFYKKMGHALHSHITQLGLWWFPEACLPRFHPERPPPASWACGNTLGLPAARSRFGYNQQSVLKCRQSDNVMRAVQRWLIWSSQRGFFHFTPAHNAIQGWQIKNHAFKRHGAGDYGSYNPLGALTLWILNIKSYHLG